MYDLSQVRLTDSVINLTGKKINLYDESNGEIQSFLPEKGDIPFLPAHREWGKKIIHYVVTKEALAKIKSVNRSLEDIAIVTRRAYGRRNVRVTSLQWAKDPSVPIWLYEGAVTTSIQHK